tara:strand:+ start:3186 stop:4082 length:897 start_codon:yes stop_codon:yes gene_type:complete
MILMKNYKSTLLLFVLSALWALHFSLVKLVDADKNPLSILVPLLVVLTILFYFVLNFNNQLFKFTFRKSIFFTVAGIFAYVVPLYVEFLVAPKMDSGILVLIVSSVPVFTLIIVWIFRLLDVNVRLILGTFFGLVGISIIILGDTNKSVNFWALLALIVPLSYSFDAIFMEKYWPNELNTFQVAFGECFASLVLLIIFNFLFDTNFSEYIYWISLPSFWLLTFVTFIEISLFFYILKIRGAVFINLGSYLVMPAGFLWGFIIFGETFTLVKLVCTLLIISSIFLIGNHEYKIKNTPIE